ncbi:hypothetical protein ACFWO4_31015, partial [Streptomyces diastaticus]
LLLSPPASVVYKTLALLPPPPGAVVAVGPADGELPLLAGRVAADGAPTAYVCRGFVCDAPTTDPALLAARLGG